MSHPLTRDLDLDDPATTELRKKIIREKVFLRRLYEEWYRKIDGLLPNVTGPVLELGSGAGFAKEYIPQLITSDILPIKGHDLCCDGHHLPFADQTFRTIAAINVFHHLPDCETFIKEAYRTVKPGGRMILLEPWVTPWSSLVYNHLHHEPFAPEAAGWKLPPAGPLSGGNDALAWIVFQRDAPKVRSRTKWWLTGITPHTPLRYLVSGGVSMRSLVPGWLFEPVTVLEKALPEKLTDKLAMFAFIILEKSPMEPD